MTIYIDNDYKCHVTDDGTRRVFDVPFFDGKCAEFIEGYRFVPIGETWIRSDGQMFTGEMIASFREYSHIAEIQDAVDRAQAQAQQTINEYEQALTEIEKALGEGLLNDNRRT